MHSKLIPLNVRTRPSVRQMIRTARLNIRAKIRHKVTMFRANWGLLSVEERSDLDSRKAFMRRAMRSMS